MNKVILLGRLTADPELRCTSGTYIPVCRFRLAVERPYQKAGEERQADFFSIVAWRSTAEFVSRFFKKGQRILVEGYLRNNDYEDNQGVRHYTVEVQAERVYFADGKVGQAQEVSQAEPEMDGFEPLDSDDDLPF